MKPRFKDVPWNDLMQSRSPIAYSNFRTMTSGYVKNFNFTSYHQISHCDQYPYSGSMISLYQNIDLDSHRLPFDPNTLWVALTLPINSAHTTRLSVVKDATRYQYSIGFLIHRPPTALLFIVLHRNRATFKFARGRSQGSKFFGIRQYNTKTALLYQNQKKTLTLSINT